MNRNKKLLLIIFLLSIILAGCNAEKQNIVYDMKGYIIKIDHQEKTMLVTESTENEDKEAHNAMWYLINDKTMILNEDNTEKTFADLEIGQKVDTWHNGIVKESYPSQTTATKIKVLSSKGDVKISEAEAIKLILTSFTEEKLWFIQKVNFDKEREWWVIEIKAYEQESRSMIYRIDANTGAFQ